MTPGFDVLVVDDEPLAREGLKNMLERQAKVSSVRVCASGADAIGMIAEQRPDVVFLDIEMPKIGGFDVIREIGAERMPQLVFVTAYAEHAVRAFEVHAVDYLLKPVRVERLAECLERLQDQAAHLDLSAYGEKLGALIERFADGSLTAYPSNGIGVQERIAVKSSGRVTFVNTAEIIWVEAAGDYIFLHTDTESHLMRETMRNMEARLLPNGFRRVHRSAIANLSYVRELKLDDGNAHSVVLANGVTLGLGRSYREGIYEALTSQS